MRSRNSVALCKPFVQRLDGCVAAMNVVLVGVAVGLAPLDATCFLTLHLDEVVVHLGGVKNVTAPPASVNELVR